jgi:hypothetical protein
MNQDLQSGQAGEEAESVDANLVLSETYPPARN